MKPWNVAMIREKMALVKDAGAFAAAMDIDAAGLPFLKNFNPPTGSKSVEELCEIVKAAGVPFIVKGIMTVKGALKLKRPVRQPSWYLTMEEESWISARQLQKFWRK